MSKFYKNFYFLNISIMMLSVLTPLLMVYTFLSTPVSQNLNSVPINNVVTEPFIKNSEISKIINTKSTTSPNLGDGELKSKILDYYQRESKNYPIVLKNDTFIGEKNLSIYVGDSVSIKNLSGNLIDITGTSGWGFDGAQKNSIFIQEFYIVGKYEYTIYPMGWKGVIEVREPNLNPN